ncbi:GNAT family N-acetyltransferase [Lewinella cohaerens]|uniref:GNAT family N-acetyltransferase n=1 Tax=Lewinella cohaerens TaxID=70995 RepID=UPI0003825682|nr:GNAT family N-acetyltransferase [Lewinella cohaerens]
MTIRQAHKEDVISIVAMLADDELGRLREDFREPLPESYYQAFKTIEEDPHQSLMVMVEQGQVIGTLQLTLIPYLTYQGGIRAQIEAVRIHKDYRGQGIGEQLFRWAIAEAEAKGAHLIQLTTDKKRPDALRFYEKLGFKASHEGMKLHF